MPDKGNTKIYSAGDTGLVFTPLGATLSFTLKEPKNEVIFNNPVTILYYKGKKYISKAHEEEFDEEKGLLMCLAKAQGISHSELKRMIKNAKRQKPKE